MDSNQSDPLGDHDQNVGSRSKCFFKENSEDLLNFNKLLLLGKQCGSRTSCKGNNVDPDQIAPLGETV